HRHDRTEVFPVNGIVRAREASPRLLSFCPPSRDTSFTGQPFRLCARMRVMLDRIAEIEEKLEALAADPDQTRERVDLLNSLGWELRVDENWHRVLELAQQARQLSEACGYQRGIAGSLRNTAFAHYLLADLARSIAEALESLRLFLEIGDRGGEAQARAVIGFVYWTLGNYD